MSASRILERLVGGRRCSRIRTAAGVALAVVVARVARVVTSAPRVAMHTSTPPELLSSGDEQRPDVRP